MTTQQEGLTELQKELQTIQAKLHSQTDDTGLFLALMVEGRWFRGILVSRAKWLQLLHARHKELDLSFLEQRPVDESGIYLVPDPTGEDKIGPSLEYCRLDLLSVQAFSLDGLARELSRLF